MTTWLHRGAGAVAFLDRALRVEFGGQPRAADIGASDAARRELALGQCAQRLLARTHDDRVGGDALLAALAARDVQALGVDEAVGDAVEETHAGALQHRAM